MPGFQRTERLYLLPVAALLFLHPALALESFVFTLHGYDGTYADPLVTETPDVMRCALRTATSSVSFAFMFLEQSSLCLPLVCLDPLKIQLPVNFLESNISNIYVDKSRYPYTRLDLAVGECCVYVCV